MKIGRLPMSGMTTNRDITSVSTCHLNNQRILRCNQAVSISKRVFIATAAQYSEVDEDRLSHFTGTLPKKNAAPATGYRNRFSHHSHLEEVVPTLKNVPDKELEFLSISRQNVGGA